MINTDSHFLLDRFVKALESLDEREKCVYDHYFSDKNNNCIYADIARICWPDRDEPVSNSMVAQVIRSIRKKFEKALFEDEDDEGNNENEKE